MEPFIKYKNENFQVKKALISQSLGILWRSGRDLPVPQLTRGTLAIEYQSFLLQ